MLVRADDQARYAAATGDAAPTVTAAAAPILAGTQPLRCSRDTATSSVRPGTSTVDAGRSAAGSTGDPTLTEPCSTADWCVAACRADGTARGQRDGALRTARTRLNRRQLR